MKQFSTRVKDKVAKENNKLVPRNFKLVTRNFQADYQSKSLKFPIPNKIKNENKNNKD